MQPIDYPTLFAIVGAASALLGAWIAAAFEGNEAAMRRIVSAERTNAHQASQIKRLTRRVDSIEWARKPNLIQQDYFSDAMNN